ncbi:MAG: TlpA disulfide reductase family protein [Dehalococcoidia bacterium]
MSQRKIVGFVVAIPAGLLIALLVWAVIQNDGNPGGIAVNNTLGEKQVSSEIRSDFNLNTIDQEETLRLSDLRGKIVMVDFWSSWCPPCRQEAPELQEAYEDFQDQDVEFVGIAIWDVDSETRKFKNAYGLEYPILVDPRGAIAVEWGVLGLPEKFFLNREGEIVKKYVGPMTRDRVGLEIREMLEKTPVDTQ